VGETRSHPRYAVEIDTELRCGDQILPARTRNVSRGGLAVVTSQPVAVGAEVSLTIALVFDEQTMSEPLPLHGRVVWCTPVAGGRFQLGATFIGLRAEERQFVDVFLRYLRDS
jgi:Tfp pilus assembly protein PilZ